MRARAARGEFNDVYQYKVITEKFRIQFVQICEDVIGLPDLNHYGQLNPAAKAYDFILPLLRKDFGRFCLNNSSYPSRQPETNWLELREFLLQGFDIEEVLSCIEIICRIIDVSVRTVEFANNRDADELATETLIEINKRLHFEKIGYRFEDRIMIRIDSDYTHKEVTQPALAALRLKHFSGSQAEFLEAHEAYRRDDKAKAIGECNKAFESLMKAICDKRGWNYAANATAKSLIEVCLKQQLIPDFWQNHFSGLRTILESAIPTARNRKSGHGSGTLPAVIPDELVPYVMHMTAATLLFLADADSRLKP